MRQLKFQLKLLKKCLRQMRRRQCPKHLKLKT